MVKLKSDFIRQKKIIPKRIKRKQKFILFCSFVIIGSLSIGTILKENNITAISEEIDSNIYSNIDSNIELEVNDNNLKDNEDNSSKKNNIEYLELSEDPNADDVAKILPETMYKWNFYRDDNRKVAYLTFDDGPSSISTNKILDILKKNDVKATFFLLGSSIDNTINSKESIKRIAKEGHAIGNHGYSHKYSILYPDGKVDVNAFMNDINKNNNLLKDILGKNFNTRLIRLPGGYSSWKGTKELDKELEKNKIYQVDWNVLNGDAEGGNKTKEELIGNFKKTLGDQETAIILMHDSDNKSSTVESLQDIINYLKLDGFEFRTLK